MSREIFPCHVVLYNINLKLALKIEEGGFPYFSRILKSNYFRGLYKESNGSEHYISKVQFKEIRHYEFWEDNDKVKFREAIFNNVAKEKTIEVHFIPGITYTTVLLLFRDFKKELEKLKSANIIDVLAVQDTTTFYENFHNDSPIGYYFAFTESGRFIIEPGVEIANI